MKLTYAQMKAALAMAEAMSRMRLEPQGLPEYAQSALSQWSMAALRAKAADARRENCSTGVERNTGA
jgi:hypothetical protein